MSDAAYRKRERAEGRRQERRLPFSKRANRVPL